MRLLFVLATLVLPVGALAAESVGDARGWFFDSQDIGTQDYVVGLDRTVRRGGRVSAFVENKIENPAGHGALIQVLKSNRYRGKRVRLSAYLRTQKVDGRAGLFLRVEGTDRFRPLSWDNMQNRPIRGSAEWAQYSIVLDVPPESVRIIFGFSLVGEGRLWADDFKFEVVDSTVATTDPTKEWTLPEEPQNLAFEEAAPGQL